MLMVAFRKAIGSGIVQVMLKIKEHVLFRFGSKKRKHIPSKRPFTGGCRQYPWVLFAGTSKYSHYILRVKLNSLTVE
jgi:hypothetical protein